MQLALVAAEASGDLLGAHLLDALRARWPGLRASGIGGPQLQQRGFDAWWPAEQLSVRGYLEVLPRLPALLRMRAQLVQRLQDLRPDLFIGVDAPDFNFAVEQRLRCAGIRTVHYISPSFWAWRRERLQVLREAADLVLCLFPFEPALLEQEGIRARYVGHPLAQAMPLQPDRAGARTSLQIPADASVLALLPGSRAAEIKFHGRLFLEAAARLLHSGHASHVLIPSLPWLQGRLQQLVQASAGLFPASDRVRVLPGQAEAAMTAADAVLVASGTATLEAALCKRPMVIAYAMPRLSHWWMRRHQQLPWVGLPNILCGMEQWLEQGAAATPDSGDFVVPELIQERATPAALAQALRDWLEQPERVHRLQQRFVGLHEQLRMPTARLAAEAVGALLES